MHITTNLCANSHTIPHPLRDVVFPASEAPLQLLRAKYIAARAEEKAELEANKTNTQTQTQIPVVPQMSSNDADNSTHVDTSAVTLLADKKTL